MKTIKSGFSRRILATVTACLLAPSAFAATISINPATATGTPGGGTSPSPIGVQFTGDGVTAGFQVDVAFDAAALSATVAGANSGSCSVPAAGIIRVIRVDGDANPLPAGPTTYCNITFSVDAGVAVPPAGDPDTVFPLVLQDAGFSDGAGDPAAGPHVLNNGEIRVQSVPEERQLTYNPATGTTIVFAAGATAGTAAPAQTITVSATGNSGTATLTGCAVTPSTVFSVTPTSLTFSDVSPGAKDLTLGCTYPTTTTAGTLECTQTNAGATATQVTWPLSCPAPNTAPTISANPASGSTFAVSGASLGTQGTRTIDLSAAGGSGTGSTTIECTSTGTVQIAASPSTPAGQGPVTQTVTGTAQPTDLRVGVVLTGSAQSPAGTVTCTVTGQADLTWTVNAPAGTTFTPPEVIPTASTWAKIALFGLLGVFGLMAVGFRRQG